MMKRALNPVTGIDLGELIPAPMSVMAMLCRICEHQEYNKADGIADD
jgi:hypothetical protein